MPRREKLKSWQVGEKFDKTGNFYEEKIEFILEKEDREGQERNMKEEENKKEK